VFVFSFHVVVDVMFFVIIIEDVLLRWWFQKK